MVDTATKTVDLIDEEFHREEILDRWLTVGVAALTLFAAWIRVSGLSNGSFYRDDAWVALTSRVPVSEAWKMVGTAPGFTMFERYWVQITSPSTWWAQLPTFLVAVLAVPLIVAICRWWGLSRWTSLLAGALIAVSHVAVIYATHLKPYSHDLIAGTVVLAAAEWWRRGNTAWLFTALAAMSFAVSFTIFPLILGCGVVILVQSISSKRTLGVIAPLAVLAGACGGLYWAVHNGISPRLKQSWQSNFFSYHSLSAFKGSFVHIFSGLIWGFGDTTPALHLAGYSKLFIVVIVVFAVIGMTRIDQTIMPLAAVIAAVAMSAFHEIALGTGRTDAYLYPAIAILVAYGAEATYRFLAAKQRYLAYVVAAGLICVVTFAGVDRATHRPTYPGGSINPVLAAAREVIIVNGGVIIEGTARWPWTYYGARHVVLVFSPEYNTGFAPVSLNPRVAVMKGTIIEGGYDPIAAVDKVARLPLVLYVRTDDWSALGDPLRVALTNACFHEFNFQHTPGYLLEWLQKGSCPEKAPHRVPPRRP